MQKISERIEKAKNILVLTHVSPDGDAIGSAFALKEGLIAIGKKAEVMVLEPLPSIYDYFNFSYINDAEYSAYDTVISVDCAGIDRIAANDLLKVDISIDHHRTNTGFAEISYTDANACATGEIIYKLLCALNAEITTNIADMLYCAISSDTGRFMFESTTKDAFLITARLMECGANIGTLNKLLFDTNSVNALMAKAVCIENLKLYESGRVAITYLDNKTMKSYNLSDADIDGLAGIPRSVEGVSISAFLKEKEENYIRVSLRSYGSYDVSKIASIFGGGGHKNASGFTYMGSVPSLIKKLVPILKGELI